MERRLSSWPMEPIWSEACIFIPCEVSRVLHCTPEMDSMNTDVIRVMSYVDGSDLNVACYSGGYYYHDSLSLSQVSAIHLKIGHL